MKLSELASRLNLTNLTPAVANGAADVSAGYVSDLLSDVLANGPAGGVLVTVQVHLTVVAVATHADLAAVIFAMDRIPDEAVRAKAAEEGIALYASPEPAFAIVGRLYELGVQGARR